MPCVSLRASIARLIGSKPEEIALTTGASPGVAAVTHGLTWKPGDEIITAKGEFPLRYATWKPMEEREGVKLKIVALAGPLYYGGRPDCRDDAENARHLRKSCAL